MTNGVPGAAIGSTGHADPLFVRPRMLEPTVVIGYYGGNTVADSGSFGRIGRVRRVDGLAAWANRGNCCLCAKRACDIIRKYHFSANSASVAF